MEQSAPGINEVLKQVKKYFTVSDCLHPDAPKGCTGRPIASHSVQRSTILESISENGHVLTFRPDIVAMLKFLGDDRKKVPEVEGADPSFVEFLGGFVAGFREGPESVGVRDASTFLGFCNAHDTSLFAPIETQALVYSPEQCFLLGYRALCFELLRKRASRGMAVWAEEAIGSQTTHDSLDGTALGLKEISESKAEYNAILSNAQFGDVSFLVWELDANPMFAASGFISPEMSFSDEPLQNIADLTKPLQSLSFTVLPKAGAGYAVLSWVGAKPCCRAFADSLVRLGDAQWPDAFLRLAAESIENFYLAPAWYESLVLQRKAWMKLRVTTGGLQLRKISYKPDGIGFAHFRARLLVDRQGS